MILFKCCTSIFYNYLFQFDITCTCVNCPLLTRNNCFNICKHDVFINSIDRQPMPAELSFESTTIIIMIQHDSCNAILFSLSFDASLSTTQLTLLSCQQSLLFLRSDFDNFQWIKQPSFSRLRAVFSTITCATVHNESFVRAAAVKNLSIMLKNQ